MKASEVIDILKHINETKNNPPIIGISVNKTLITVCYENEYHEVIAESHDYKNTDLY